VVPAATAHARRRADVYELQRVHTK
jgi:hypothetical protein